MSYRDERIEKEIKVMKNIDVSPYPSHLGGERLVFIENILEHELKKKEAGRTAEDVSKKWESKKEKLFASSEIRQIAIRDFYNEFWAEMEGKELKTGLTALLTAENAQVTLQSITIQDIMFTHYFVKEQLKIPGARSSMTGQELREYYENDSKSLQRQREISEKSFDNGKISRAEDPIVVINKEVNDGHGRLMKAIRRGIEAGIPLTQQRIPTWVVAITGKPINYWVPTNELMREIGLAVSDSEETESSKRRILKLFRESSSATIEFGRATAGYKDERGLTFINEIRQSWEKMKKSK